MTGRWELSAARGRSVGALGARSKRIAFIAPPAPVERAAVFTREMSAPRRNVPDRGARSVPIDGAQFIANQQRLGWSPTAPLGCRRERARAANAGSLPSRGAVQNTHVALG